MEIDSPLTPHIYRQLRHVYLKTMCINADLSQFWCVINRIAMEKFLTASLLFVVAKFIAHVALAIQLVGHLVK